MYIYSYRIIWILCNAISLSFQDKFPHKNLLTVKDAYFLFLLAHGRMSSKTNWLRFGSVNRARPVDATHMKITWSLRLMLACLAKTQFARIRHARLHTRQTQFFNASARFSARGQRHARFNHETRGQKQRCQVDERIWEGGDWSSKWLTRVNTRSIGTVYTHVFFSRYRVFWATGSGEKRAPGTRYACRGCFLWKRLYCCLY